MSCSDFRHQIHLEVGGDLVTDEQNAVAAHLERCSECRAYRGGMLKAMTALQTLRGFDPPFSNSGKSNSAVWQAVAAKLPTRSWRPAVQKQFNTRVVALCVCSVALAVVSIVQSLPVAKMSQPGLYGTPGRLASGQFSSNDSFGSARRVSSGVPQNDGTAPQYSGRPMNHPVLDEPNSF